MTTDKTVSDLFVDESCKLLDQSMNKIRNCIDQLSDEQIWWRPADPLNSIGNLMMHLAGNLRQWTIAGIGGAIDDRNRPTEFAQRDVIGKAELMDRLATAVEDAKRLFGGLSSDQLTESRTIQDFEVSVLGAISHTTSHFVGHTHQIIYITRLTLGDQYRFQWTPAEERGDVPI